MNSNAISTGLAADPKALGDLKRRALQNPEEGLKAAARQFEMLLMDMVMKSMRNTASGESLLDNEGTRMFTSLLDQEYAHRLAERGGLGLADLIVKQLTQLKRS